MNACLGQEALRKVIDHWDHWQQCVSGSNISIIIASSASNIRGDAHHAIRRRKMRHVALAITMKAFPHTISYPSSCSSSCSSIHPSIHLIACTIHNTCKNFERAHLIRLYAVLPLGMKKKKNKQPRCFETLRQMAIHIYVIHRRTRARKRTHTLTNPSTWSYSDIVVIIYLAAAAAAAAEHTQFTIRRLPTTTAHTRTHSTTHWLGCIQIILHWST